LEKITLQRLDELFRAFKDQRFLVVGDLILDEYTWGEVERISPEAPVPVVAVRSKTYRLGGAGNVARNVAALGGVPVTTGFLGQDMPGKKFIRKVRESRMPLDGIVKVAGRPTTVKERILAQDQQILRMDREVTEWITTEQVNLLLERIRSLLDSATGVIISDYGKGLLTPDLLRELIRMAAERGVIVTVDPKESHFDLYRGAGLVTPNQKEAEKALGRRFRDEDDLVSGGVELRSRIGCRALLITRGPQGMSLFLENGRVFHNPTRARQVYDVTGAGDTVIAAATLALASGASYKEAATIANHAAGVVVGKFGTATATPVEIKRSMGYE